MSYVFQRWCIRASLNKEDSNATKQLYLRRIVATVVDRWRLPPVSLGGSIVVCRQTDGVGPLVSRSDSDRQSACRSASQSRSTGNAARLPDVRDNFRRHSLPLPPPSSFAASQHRSYDRLGEYLSLHSPWRRIRFAMNTNRGEMVDVSSYTAACHHADRTPLNVHNRYERGAER